MDRFRNTTLHNAMRFCKKSEKHLDCAKLLLNHEGVQVDIANLHKETPLHMAIQEFAPGEVIQQLLDKGCNSNALNRENQNAITSAVKHQNYEAYLALVKHEADRDDKTSLDKLLNQLLFAAVDHPQKKADDRIVKDLIDRGANIHATSNVNDRTVMFVAARNNRASVIQMLTKRGAKVNIKDSTGTKPYRVAMDFGQEDAVTALVSNGAKPKRKWFGLGDYDLSSVKGRKDIFRSATEKGEEAYKL